MLSQADSLSGYQRTDPSAEQSANSGTDEQPPNRSAADLWIRFDKILSNVTDHSSGRGTKRTSYVCTSSPLSRAMDSVVGRLPERSVRIWTLVKGIR